MTINDALEKVMSNSQEMLDVSILIVRELRSSPHFTAVASAMRDLGRSDDGCAALTASLLVAGTLLLYDELESAAKKRRSQSLKALSN